MNDKAGASLTIGHPLTPAWFRPAGLACLIALAGCASTPKEIVLGSGVVATNSGQPIAEAGLLDVGVQVFDAGLEEGDAEKEGVYPEVRRAEAHYIPYHLAKTLQLTGHWGAVRVVPAVQADVDLTVRGRIISSSGEELVLRIGVEDATGRQWFSREYETRADAMAYEGLQRGIRDPFQSLYNTVSNDMSVHLLGLEDEQRRDIRRLSRLRFAADVAPFAYAGYILRRHGRYRVVHLPAEDDPMAERIDRIRHRERMLVDTINKYYADYYDAVWDTYVDWREAYRWESENDREHGRGSPTVMLVGGYEVYRSAKGYAPDALVYTTAFTGLESAFGPRVQPLITEVEGRTVRLTGTYEQKFKQWRLMLRELFAAETGAERRSAATSSQLPAASGR